MNIYINNQLKEVSNQKMSLKDLAISEKINMQGTAIAINDKLIKQALWETTMVKENDNITIISAAFGG